ncbi:MAG: hypothetical protein ACTHJ1_09285 [Bordetella sp.]|uniref:hypothetical protein n=1 Tax=Bordetella sp. TaxID=28081 RepID=UPI003F7BD8A3
MSDQQGDNTIHIGNRSDAPFLAFGDDSQYKGTLVFAYAIVPRQNLTKALRQLKRIKMEFRFPAKTPIHCRTLFSGHDRQKKGLGHLNQDQASFLIRRIIDLMNERYVYVRYSYVLEESYAKFFGGKDSIPLTLSNAEGDTREESMHSDPKGMLGMLAQMCWGPASNDQGPLATDCDIYASKDKTKARLFGDERKQAHNWIPGYTTAGAPPEKIFHIAPSTEAGDLSIFFELADVSAYVLSHALQGVEAEPLFHELGKSILYWSRSEWCFDPLDEISQ